MRAADAVGRTWTVTCRLDPAAGATFARVVEGDAGPAAADDVAHPSLVVARPLSLLLGDVVTGPDALLDPTMVAHVLQDSTHLREVAPDALLQASTTVVAVGSLGLSTGYDLRSTIADETGPVAQARTVFADRRGVEGAPLDIGGDAVPARAGVLGERSRAITAAEVATYAAASGDTNPIHLDEAVARAVGLPGVIVHGLFTLAWLGAAAAAVHGSGPAVRVRARFTRPLLAGETAVATFHRTPAPGTVGVDVHAHGTRLVRSAWCELDR